MDRRRGVPPGAAAGGTATSYEAMPEQLRGQRARRKAGRRSASSTSRAIRSQAGGRRREPLWLRARPRHASNQAGPPDPAGFRACPPMGHRPIAEPRRLHPVSSPLAFDSRRARGDRAALREPRAWLADVFSGFVLVRGSGALVGPGGIPARPRPHWTIHPGAIPPNPVASGNPHHASMCRTRGPSGPPVHH